MQNTQTYITRMTLFVLAVLLLGILLKDTLLIAFMANMALNGVILATLALGMIFAFRRIFESLPGETMFQAVIRECPFTYLLRRCCRGAAHRRSMCS